MAQLHGDELTTADVADLIGVSTTTVLSYVEKDLLPCRLLPSGHRRYLRADVDALLSSAPKKKAS